MSRLTLRPWAEAEWSISGGATNNAARTRASCR